MAFFSMYLPPVAGTPGRKERVEQNGWNSIEPLSNESDYNYWTRVHSQAREEPTMAIVGRAIGRPPNGKSHRKQRSLRRAGDQLSPLAPKTQIAARAACFARLPF